MVAVNHQEYWMLLTTACVVLYRTVALQVHGALVGFKFWNLLFVFLSDRYAFLYDHFKFRRESNWYFGATSQYIRWTATILNYWLGRKLILENIDVKFVESGSHTGKLVWCRIDRIMYMNVMLRGLTTHQTSTKQKLWPKRWKTNK